MLDHDLAKAREIQKSLLPDVIPQINGLEISGTMNPAMQIGGDYFDIIKINNSKTFVVIGDVSDKGLSASFYMSKLQTMVHLYCNEHNTPRDILTKINRNIYTDIEKNWFITCTVAMLDMDSRTMNICRAGHTPLIQLRKGEISEITPAGIGIALEQGEIFDEKLEELEFKIESGDLFSFYSDGVTEAMNRNKDFFGVENLISILKSSKDKSTSAIRSEILDSLEKFRGNTPQNDDITFVLVKIK